MKKLLLVLALIFASNVATYAISHQLATAQYRILWTFTGNDQTEANRERRDFFGYAVLGSSASADIWQRNSDGSLILNAQGKPIFDAQKINDVFRERIKDTVQGWAVDGEAADLLPAANASVVTEVQKRKKPVVEN